MTRVELTDVLPGLTAALVDGSNPATFLSRFVAGVPVVLDVTACALLAADPAGRIRIVTVCEHAEASSFTGTLRDGPWNDCLVTGLSDVNIDVAVDDERWRTFRRVAAGNGVGFAHVLPVQVGGRVLGVLAMVSGAHQPLDPTAAAVAQALADLAAVALLHGHQVPPGQRLGAAWKTSDSTARAIGMLRSQGASGTAEAYERLSHHATAWGIPLPELCTDVLGRRVSWPDLVAGTPTPDDAPGARSVQALADGERQLLVLLASGLPATVVAVRLGISLPRMATLLVALRRRLGVTTTVQAVRVARHSGLI